MFGKNYEKKLGKKTEKGLLSIFNALWLRGKKLDRFYVVAFVREEVYFCMRAHNRGSSISGMCDSSPSRSANSPAQVNLKNHLIRNILHGPSGWEKLYTINSDSVPQTQDARSKSDFDYVSKEVLRFSSSSAPKRWWIPLVSSQTAQEM